jgi:hypothetical protein
MPVRDTRNSIGNWNDLNSFSGITSFTLFIMSAAPSKMAVILKASK